MKSSVCLCVLMAILVAGALSQPVAPAEAVDSAVQRAEEAPRRQLRAAVLRTDGEPRARLGALIARYIQQARKGKDIRSPPRCSCDSWLSILIPQSTCQGRKQGTHNSKIFTSFPEVRFTALCCWQVVFEAHKRGDGWRVISLSVVSATGLGTTQTLTLGTPLAGSGSGAEKA